MMRGNESQIEYGTQYACTYPTKTISAIPDPNGGANGATSALVTTAAYDFNTGLPRETIDPNEQKTEIQYDDLLLRPTRTITPNGQQIITEYGAGTSAETVSSKIRLRLTRIPGKNL